MIKKNIELILDRMAKGEDEPNETIDKLYELLDSGKEKKLLTDFIKWLIKDYEVEGVYEMYVDEFLCENK
jgi:hypothetical protein